MKSFVAWGALTLSGLVLGSIAIPAQDSSLLVTAKGPVAPIRPFDETLYGVKISDPYRYMESLNPETLDWMKAQGANTRRIFDSIAPRAAFEQRLAAFGASFGVVVSPSPGAQPYELFGGQLFYTGREPGSDNLDLFVKDPKLGTRKLFDVGKLRAANNGKPYAINYFQASPDGTKVALGLSEGGSEDASLFVYDVATGARTAGPVDRAEYASPSWTDDGRILYFMRLAAPKPGEAPTAKYLNATTQVWDLKSAPRDVIGTAAANAARLNLTPEEFPIVQLFAGAPFAVFDNVNGVQHEQELWLAPLAEAAGTNAPWKLLAARSDNVTAMDVRGEEIYLLSHQDAPTFKVLALRAGQKLTDAITLVPPQPDRVLESIYAARGVVFMREGADSGFCHVCAGAANSAKRGDWVAKTRISRIPGATLSPAPST